MNKILDLSGISYDMVADTLEKTYSLDSIEVLKFPKICSYIEYGWLMGVFNLKHIFVGNDEVKLLQFTEDNKIITEALASYDNIHNSKVLASIMYINQCILGYYIVSCGGNKALHILDIYLKKKRLHEII